VRAAIQYLEQCKSAYLKWYMSHERVSLAMMCEKDDTVGKYDWAIKTLRGAPQKADIEDVEFVMGSKPCRE